MGNRAATAKYQVHASAEQIDRWREQAEKEGMVLSDWIRARLDESVERGPTLLQRVEDLEAAVSHLREATS